MYVVSCALWYSARITSLSYNKESILLKNVKVKKHFNRIKYFLKCFRWPVVVLPTNPKPGNFYYTIFRDYNREFLYKDNVGHWQIFFLFTVYPKKYAHGFVVLCFVVVMQSFIMNSHEVFIHIHQGCFAGTGAIIRLPQCQWSKPDGYGKISQCITTTKHSKAKTVCIFLGIYCNAAHYHRISIYRRRI